MVWTSDPSAEAQKPLEKLSVSPAVLPEAKRLVAEPTAPSSESTSVSTQAEDEEVEEEEEEVIEDGVKKKRKRM